MTGEKILIVDDGKENREFLVEYVLHPNGYDALIAKDGKEGLDMAIQYMPDLMLLDLQMPRMDGLQVLREMSARNLNIPVILMTFHGSEEIAVEVYRLGVRDYVKKPYSVEEMFNAIEHSLNESRLQREKDALTERVIHANRELQKRVQELNVLYSVGKSVTELLNMNELLPRIVDAATQITGAEEGYIHLVEDGHLICRAQKTYNSGRARSASFEANDRVALQVLKHNQPLVLTREQLGGNPNSAACVPVVFRNELIGVLGVVNVSTDSHTFTKHESALLSTLTDYAAIAIANSRNYEELRQTKDRENAQMRGSFERLVPPSVVNHVINNPGDLKLGGRRQEISVIFADIRGYTTWSENAPPEEAVAMLNDYLSLTAEIILAWDGTLDKYLGDGLMAIFNAPNEHPDHVHRATDAALALMRATEEMRTQRGHDLVYSIGVHVGEAVVGYIGTDRAMNYTAIGDVVNVAKRLQELAPPGEIWVEESVVSRLGNLIDAKPLGEVKIRGRKKSAYAYQLLGLNPKYPV